MRRFLTLVCLLSLAVPAGISISGCTRNPGENYCNGLGYGMKITDVATITLQPATTGISMAFGQTHQMSSPSALTCKGSAASASSFTYGTTNNQLVDISPAGNICAGTWNRNTGGGIANYTICTAPSTLPSTGGLPYATAYVTASAQSVTSNPVEVFVHPQVTSVGLVTTPLTTTGQQCFSQGTQATLDAQACYANSSNQQVQLCAPAGVTQCPYASGDARCSNTSLYYACPGGLPSGVTSVPTCTASIGTLTYTVGTSAIASIATNTSTNVVTITAEQPGTTAITASVAESGSSAGYFSTCPPASISLTMANGGKSGSITQGATQNLVTSTTDTYGNALTGLTLTYQSTDPIDISVNSAGAVTTSYPGVASVYAVCEPPSCNPSPINEVGIYGTGLPVSSNPVTITTPGTASEYLWFSAPGQSQDIIPYDMLYNTAGSTIRLPYVPNSMMMDRLGNNLYLGSTHELMIYNTTSGTVTPSTAAYGVVLAVSPNDAYVLVNDQIRQVFYLYSVSAGTATTFGGMGAAAAWTPDSDTLYVTDSAALGGNHADKLYIYNANTGWTTYDTSTTTGGSQNLAITIPSVGAFLSGSSTVAHTWCPSGTVGDYSSMSFYPQGDVVLNSSDNPVKTDVLAATTDGSHIIGASTTGTASAGGNITLSDIGVTIPAYNCLPAESSSNYPLILGDTLSPLALTTSLSTTPTITADAAAVNQVVPSPTSSLAFITYTPPTTGATTGVSLPYYLPDAGTVGYVTFKGSSAASITAPLVGAFSPDNKLFFVSTAGDNLIHLISVPALTDTQQISPNLPACTPVSAGGSDSGCTYSGSDTYVPATALAVKPRATT